MVLIRFAADRPWPAGSLRVDDGPERAFSGWLELMRELEDAHGPLASAATDERDESR